MGEALASPAARYYFAHKAVGALAIPFTAALVIARLSPAEQGFFFAILSLVAFQLLGEFGFNAALAHFASHEASRLTWRGGIVQGPQQARDRLAALVRIAVKWTAAMSALLVVVLGAAGAAFLGASAESDDVQWRAAWWLVCLGVPLSMLAAAGRALAEGSGDVASSQRSLLWGMLSGQAATWVALLAGAGLLSVALGQLAGGIVGLLMIASSLRPVLDLARSHQGPRALSWRGEFWPHQWRIGLSWTCGLLMFQSFVPFVFWARGAAEAGQAGVLLQAFALANALGMAWVTLGQARLGHAWAHGDAAALLRERRSMRWRAVLTTASAGLAALVLLLVLRAFAAPLAERIGPLAAMAWLMLCAVVLQFSNVDTAVVRFGKTEPFLRNSVAGAAVVTLANWQLAPLGVAWVFAGFALAMSVVVVPWVQMIATRQLAKA